MKYLITFCLIFYLDSMLYPQQLEFPLNVEDETGNLQTLIVGYDPFGTDGLDIELGEVNIPQVPTGNFGARFKLPVDPNITTVKDIRFGCGQPFGYEHYIDLSYMSGINDMFIYWEAQFEVIYLIFKNGYNGNTIASFDLIFGADTFYVPSNLDKITVQVYYNGPLTWPEVYLHAPSGGEIFQVGETVPIHYSVNIPIMYSFLLQYTTNNGNDWVIIDTVSSSGNIYNWTVPNITSNNVKLRIGDFPCVYDTSNGTFLVYNNSLPALHPVQIPIKIHNSVGDTVNLIAGMNPDATNGLDTTLGETNQQPPLPGNFNSFLKLSDNSLSNIDYQPGYHFYIGGKTYSLLVYPKSDSLTTLNVDLPAGTILKIRGQKRVPNGYLFFDTTFTSGNVVYTFPQGTYYANNVIKLEFTFDGTIPVELISFTANVQSSNVFLSWITASELNNSGFEVERSHTSTLLSMTKWDEIGFIEGNGTTTEQQFYSYTDDNLSAGKYQYRLKQIDFDGTFEYSDIVEVEINQPLEFSLSQNYPNPFNPATKIKYTISDVIASGAKQSQFVTLKVYDVLGNEIATLVNEEQSPGNYEIEFNPASGNRNLPAGRQGLASGIYYYKLRAGDLVETKKMIYLK